MSETKTGAAQFRELTKDRERKIIDVNAPSGMIYRRYAPSTYTLLFEDETMPQNATSAALEEWSNQGIDLLGEEVKTESPDTESPDTESPEKIDPAKRALMIKAMNIRDRVLTNSYSPKLVLGEAQNEDELSVQEVLDKAPEDIDFLYKFEAAGGQKSVMLKMFPEGSGSGALASASRKKQRHPRK